MKILFIGDIVGRIGRQTIAKLLPQIKKTHKPDLVIANAENSAHGSGVTEKIIKELMGCGIDYMTTGDHAFKHPQRLELFDNYPILRPDNLPPGLPGSGQALISVGKQKIALINLIGRVFMKLNPDCPFRKFDEILANLNLRDKDLSAIIVDIHAEATSEKVCFCHYADGRAQAVLGTHTHIMTADQKISSQGTAYISDVGMTGFSEGSLGVEKDGAIKNFLTQVKHPHVIPEKGKSVLNAVLINIDGRDRRATSIKPIIKQLKIK